MKKRAKRIAAMLLALTMICQPSWGGTALAAEETAAAETTVEASADQQTGAGDQQSDAEVQQVTEADQQNEAEEKQQAMEKQAEEQRLAQERAEKEKADREQQKEEQRAVESRKEDSVEVQARDSLSAPAPAETTDEFKGIYLEKIRRADGETDEIQAGNSMDVIFTWKNTTDDTVVLGNISAYWGYEETDDSLSREHYLYAEKSVASGESADITMSVEANAFEAPHSWSFESVSCNVYDRNDNYLGSSTYYTDENFYSNWDRTEIPQELYYEYNGEVDYRVINDGVIDVTAPVIDSITVDPEEISTYDKVTAVVNYTEKDSGITQVNLRFISEETGEEESFDWYGNVGDGRTDGHLEISLNGLRMLNDTYTLTYAYIEDDAGYGIEYTPGDDGKLHGYDGDESVLEPVSYQVTEEGSFDAVIIEDISLEGSDKDQMSAGDKFDLVVTLKNNLNQEITVDGSAVWENTGYQWVYSDQSVAILPGMTGKLRIPVETSKYWSKGTYELQNIMYNVRDRNDHGLGQGDYYVDAYYTWNDYETDSYISIPDSMGYTYSGGADYTITDAPHADTTEPSITGIYIMEEGITDAEVGTYDKIRAFVDYEEEGSGVQYISVGYSNDESETEWFTLYENVTTEGQYVGKGTVELESRYIRKLDDTYRLTDVTIRDFAGNERYYGLDESTGRLTTYDGESSFAGSSYTVKYKTELKYLLIENMQLTDNNGTPVNKDQLTAGDSFNLAVTLKNNTLRDVTVTGGADWYSEGKTKSAWSEGSGVQILSGESGVLMIPVETSKYESVRTWLLETVNYNAVGMNGESVGYGYYSIDAREGYVEYYTYTDYLTDSEFGDYVNIPEGIRYEYDGSGNYVIADAPEADEEAPMIQSIRAGGSGDLEISIDTMTDLSLDITYTEEGSGISSFRAVFVSESGDREEFMLDYAGEEQYKGTGETFSLSSQRVRELGSTYKLTYVETSDYAGNSRTYTLSADGTQLLPSDGTAGIESVSYTVSAESNEEVLLPGSIRLENPDDPDFDRTNITAGGTFDLVWEVDNRLQGNITGTISASWNSMSGRYISEEHAFSLSESENEIRLPVEVSRFAAKDQYRLTRLIVSVNNETDEYVVGSLRMYSVDGECIWNAGGGELSIPYEYVGGGDYWITEEDTPDTEAPYIRSIKLLTQDVEAPGMAEFEIKADTGAAQLTDLTIYIQDADEENNSMVYLEPEDLYYSQQRQSYIFKAFLSENIAGGTYHFDQISVLDEADQSRYYQAVEGSMMMSGTESFEDSTFKVTNTTGLIRDFEAPEIHDLRVDKTEVQPGDSITFLLDAVDMSGVSHLVLAYRNEEIGQTIYYTVLMENTGENTWEGRLDTDPYMQSGTYELWAISAYDANPVNNSANLTGDEYSKIFGQCSFSVKGEADYIYIPMVNGDFSQLDNAEEGQTVVFTASDYIEISADVMEIIQQKKLKAVFISAGSDSQLIVDGAELTDDMEDSYFNVYVGTTPTSALYGTVLEFENGYDKVAQHLFVETYSNVRIPYTVRWKIEQDLLEKTAEQGNARLSEYTGDSWKIIDEDVKFTEDGYFEKEYADGFIGYEDFMVSTDTVKYFDYPLTVTATPSFTSDTITKGSSFEVDLTITNPNKKAMTDVAVFTMINTEEALECDWCTFESADDSVVTAANGAVIGSIEAGETVRLTAKFNIPEDTDYERVPLLFVATSLTDDEQEIVSRGDDEIKITLQDKMAVLKGDITLDGLVDGGDLLYMLRVVSKRVDIDTLTQEQLYAGDVESNGIEPTGTIDGSDLLKLLRFVSKRITTLE